jgi:hypothetical protein
VKVNIAYRVTRFSDAREMGFAGENPKRIRISNIDPKFRRRKRSLGKSILMEREVKDFVDSILATNTRKSYIRSLSIFEEYM